LDSAVAMLNFDMVGRLKDDRLIVYGAATADEFRGMLDSANAATRFNMTATGDGYGASDHSSFYAKGMPVLHFFTDVHPDYHRSTDDIERINAGGEARVVSLAEKVLREIANHPSRLTFRRPAAATQRTSTCRTEVALGTIPNMGAVDVGGLQLSGVREGSPGDKGGLKAGDIVVDFAGKTVKDIYDYQDALCSHKPDDVVQITVMRDGQPVKLTVTLGRRSR
jgi:C-terminal processing protease CtpA/Prc